MVNHSFSGGKNKNSSPTSAVVVVKKKKFLGRKKNIIEAQSELDKDIEQKTQNTEEFKVTNNIDHKISSHLKSNESKIRNLDNHFSESKKKTDNKAKLDKVDNLEIKALDKLGYSKDNNNDINLDKKENKANTKNFLTDIKIVSSVKDKRLNDVNESSNYLVRSKYNDKKRKNLYDDDDIERERLRSIASIKRAREKQRRSSDNKITNEAEKKQKEVIIPEVITVQELANKMAVRSQDLVKELMKMGMMITATKSIDADTAELLVGEFGYIAKRVSESDVEKILEDPNRNDPKKQKSRYPVVAVMGHVDHGKTSLLDALRKTDIVSSESGGITQHIGASVVKVNKDHSVTFLDTPGHEAFTAMRLRGAHATDIVILVVAADDGIKEQTIEAINHAKAAKTPIIVAINKIDKPGANVQRISQDLLEHEVILETMGGDTLCVEVSAKNKQNLDKLIDAVLLQSEILEIKANPDCNNASGVVIESKIDKNKGIISTFLVQSGTMKVGDIVVAGCAYGKVRVMNNDRGQKVNSLLPSEPAEIMGLNDIAESGQEFYVVESEKVARDIVEYRIKKNRDIEVARKSKKTLDDIFSDMSSSDKLTELPIIIKADVKGSVEAIISSVEKLSNDEVKIKVIHSAVGGITESDIILAKASNAIILGFNVRISGIISDKDSKEIDIRYYSIIYDLIDDVKSISLGMLKPLLKEIPLGKGEIRQVFDLSKYGKVAGSYVTSGILKRSGKCRIIRDSVVVSDTEIKAIKHYKNDVSEVKTGSECGISFENCTSFQEGDILEFYEVVEEKRK